MLVRRCDPGQAVIELRRCQANGYSEQRRVGSPHRLHLTPGLPNEGEDTLMSVVNSRATLPGPQGLLPSKYTGPAMRL
jgi:hypothetical protein